MSRFNVSRSKTMAFLRIFILFTQLLHALCWKTFVVPSAGGGADDTPALLAALPEYTANSTILFKKGVYYNILTPIRFPVLTNVEVRVEGNLTYPTDIPTIQGKLSFGATCDRRTHAISSSYCCFVSK